MRLEPFRSVDGNAFSLARDELLRRRGKPTHEHRNAVGLNELDYTTVVFRFQDCGRLEEVTALARVVHLGSVAVPFASLEAFVREQDPTPFQRAGFLVSPALGLAF